MFNFTANGGHPDYIHYYNGKYHEQNNYKKGLYIFFLSSFTLELFKPITNAILFYSRAMTMPGICTYQFTSPDRSTFLTFLLND